MSNLISRLEELRIPLANNIINVLNKIDRTVSNYRVRNYL